MTAPALTPDARSALLQAARSELVEHGIVAVGLRAVARRAGLSHAAPGYFFGDRAGMLTALAAEGFSELSEALARVEGPRPDLASLGGAYIDFGLANGALFDLMFQRDAVHPDDLLLQAAQRRAIEPLLQAVEVAAASRPATDALMSWALVHGLVTLARQQALPVDDGDVEGTLRTITTRFAQLLR